MSNHKIFPDLAHLCKRNAQIWGKANFGDNPFFLNEAKRTDDFDLEDDSIGNEVYAEGLGATVTLELEKEILEGKSSLKLKQVLYEIG